MDVLNAKVVYMTNPSAEDGFNTIRIDRWDDGNEEYVRTVKMDTHRFKLVSAYGSFHMGVVDKFFLMEVGKAVLDGYTEGVKFLQDVKVTRENLYINPELVIRRV